MTVQLCCICEEELNEDEAYYCEDCRCAGDLEDVLALALIHSDEKKEVK